MAIQKLLFGTAFCLLATALAQATSISYAGGSRYCTFLLNGSDPSTPSFVFDNINGIVTIKAAGVWEVWHTTGLNHTGSRVTIPQIIVNANGSGNVDLTVHGADYNGTTGSGLTTSSVPSGVHSLTLDVENIASNIDASNFNLITSYIDGGVFSRSSPHNYVVMTVKDIVGSVNITGSVAGGVIATGSLKAGAMIQIDGDIQYADPNASGWDPNDPNRPPGRVEIQQDVEAAADPNDPNSLPGTLSVGGYCAGLIAR